MLVTTIVSAQQVARSLTTSSGLFMGFYEYVPVDYNVDPSVKYPVIIFLHGIGERGNGTTELSRVLANGIPRYIDGGHPMRFFWNGKWETFIVLSPQLNASYGYWANQYISAMLQHAKSNLRIDTNRVFLAGMSLGGGGVWTYATSSLSNAKQIAGIGAVCGICSGGTWCNFRDANLPVWAFHAQDDGSVGVGCTIGHINNINACTPSVKPYMTIWPNGNHWIWDRAFDTDYNWQNPNLFEWFLGQNKSLPVNNRPVARAGNNITISTTTGQVNLSGAASTDADGTLVRFIWRKISGPSFGTIANAVSTNGLSAVTGLSMPGVYAYELKAVDDRADYTLDTIQITVTNGIVSNIPPVAAAGQDRVIAATNATLNGTNSYDPDGSVVSYKWRMVDGPGQYTIDNDSTPTPYVYNLATGSYKFQLEAIDNAGAVSFDTVVILETSELLTVKFGEVKVRTGNEGILLEWSTFTEYNNEKFDIQTSSDGIAFRTIGVVKGSGTSLEPLQYKFSIAQVDAKEIYFRLRQTGFDGKVTYSAIVQKAAISTGIRLNLQPNPVRNTLHVLIENAYKGALLIRITGLDGQTLKTHQINKQIFNINTSIPVKEFPAGIYTVEITMGVTREVRKFVKL